MTIENLISGHAEFKKDYKKHGHRWSRLVKEGQYPSVLWIGCSDSRVIPEQITGARPGEIFVMRNVANIVPPYGSSGESASAVLEFAALVLRVEHIIVCGHTFCGGVEAVIDQKQLSPSSPLARWISWIQPAVSQVNALSLPEEDRYNETIKANVLLQRQNVESYPEVSNAVKGGKLRLHAWLFDLETGELSAFNDSTALWHNLSPSLNE